MDFLLDNGKRMNGEFRKRAKLGSKEKYIKKIENCPDNGELHLQEPSFRRKLKQPAKASVTSSKERFYC